VRIKGMAHITGGGLLLNVPRMLPDDVQARIERSRWTRPAVFDWLQAHGNVEDDEMHRVFNCGIGLVLVVAASDSQAAQKALRSAYEDAFKIGEIVPREGGAAQTVVV